MKKCLISLAALGFLGLFIQTQANQVTFTNTTNEDLKCTAAQVATTLQPIHLKSIIIPARNSKTIPVTSPMGDPTPFASKSLMVNISCHNDARTKKGKLDEVSLPDNATVIIKEVGKTLNFEIR